MSLRWDRIIWYAGRLRAMSPREIAHRVGEARVRRDWRRQPIGWGVPGVDAPLPAFPSIRHALAAAGAMPNPALLDSMSRLRPGLFRFLGRDWPPDRPDAGDFWFHDPVHGGRWPGAAVSSFSVDVRTTWPDGGAVPAGARGDVKYVWEANRLQHLHPAAVAWAAGDAEAGARSLAILRDWCACNPPYGGVNWVSGIEIALRLVSVALLCAAAGPDGFAPADRAFLRAVVHAHARHLAAFPSLFSSANNHRVAEGLGLLVAGCLLGDAGHTWEGEGRAILEVEAARQILPDGVGAEQSPTYQAFTMEMLAFGVLLCRDAGRPLAPLVAERLAAGAVFLRTLMNGAGVVPAIGDDDEGRVLAQPPDREPLYVASIVAAVAGLAGRPELLPPARDPHWRDHLFGVPCLGPPADGHHDAQNGQAMFRDGGYTVARATVGARRATLVFDHGPLGYLSLAAHGHADALALWLDVDDTPVLIDPGTYLYHSGRGQRTTLRESLAHSTLVVAGLSQSVARPGFSWASRAAGTLVAEAPGTAWSVTGRHDGYRRRLGVLHERSLSRAPDGFVIQDRLVGATTPLAVEIRFVLNPDLDLALAGRTFVVSKGGQALCRLDPPTGFAAATREGLAEAPMSRGFGDLAGGRRLIVSGQLGAAAVTTKIEILSGLIHGTSNAAPRR